MKAQTVLSKLDNIKRSGEGWTARCPAHSDEHNSLSISERSDGSALVHCHAGCSYDSILKALGGDLKQMTTVYDYVDEHGDVIFQVCRRVPDKKFFQRRPDGKGGYSYDLKDVRRVLYRLTELLEAEPSITVFIVEGEKDADTLHVQGALATCNAGGAGKWRDEYSDALRGRNVVILPDNDKPGREHAEAVARSLWGKAASIKVLELPGLPDKGDVSDWLRDGSTIEALYELADSAPLYAPVQDEEEDAAQELIDIARTAELFVTPFGDTYATYKTPQGHTKTCAVDSQEFRQWLTYSYMKAANRPPRKEELNATVNAVQGYARYEGEERKVYTRLAAHAGKIYLDLCDKERRVAEASSDGWRIISADNAPVRFRHAKGMLSLPPPIAGGDVGLLRQFVNVANDEDFILLAAWLVAALRGDAMKFPVLSLTGEQGSAKSTVSLMLRNLIDPNAAPLRNSVRNQWDATLAANNSWCVILNNISELPQWLSDTLCCIADGIGFAARTHHSMTEETLFQASRPIILNGITDIATRADLLDRAVCLHLPAIPKEKRLDDAALFAEFERARPMILGGLLNGVCAALRNLPHVQLKKLPRMADFAKWATASESGLGLDSGAFMAAYDHNRNAASDAALEASPVANPLLNYVREQGEVTISLQALLNALAAQFPDSKAPADFPKSAQKLSAELKRCGPHLRAAGLTMQNAGREGGKGSTMYRFTFK